MGSDRIAEKFKGGSNFYYPSPSGFISLSSWLVGWSFCLRTKKRGGEDGAREGAGRGREGGESIDRGGGGGQKGGEGGGGGVTVR